ncbi:MAG: DNA integrity scanning diadenylate cyclase DisA [Clostridia bacterium]
MKYEEILELLKILAPGTVLREGLENVLKAKTGALIVIGDSEEILKISDGGFNIDQEFTPAAIYELAKMDGGIVISNGAKKILRANVQFVPESKIKTKETGTRHRTAERVAKQTGELVICISQRRGIITIFKGDFRYVINNTETILTRANQALETLEKYKLVLDSVVNILGELEFDDLVSLETVVTAIYRAEVVMRMNQEVERNIVELGDEGRLVKMQLDELVANVEQEENNIIMDYLIEDKIKSKSKARKFESVLSEIRKLEKSELISGEKVAKLLGYETDTAGAYLDLNVSPRGYRMLSKIPKVPYNIVINLIDSFTSLQGICRASIDDLDDVDGIGEARARGINQGLRRLQEQYLLKGFRNII